MLLSEKKLRIGSLNYYIDKLSEVFKNTTVPNAEWQILKTVYVTAPYAVTINDIKDPLRYYYFYVHDEGDDNIYLSIKLFPNIDGAKSCLEFFDNDCFYAKEVKVDVRALFEDLSIANTFLQYLKEFLELLLIINVHYNSEDDQKLLAKLKLLNSKLYRLSSLFAYVSIYDR